MSKQKEIAQQLDRAAARAESVSAQPASSKQCWFLAKLIADNNEDYGHITEPNYVLTKKRASEDIDFLLNENK